MSKPFAAHADFLAAPERQRYTRGPLAGLWVLLNQELEVKPTGAWCWRVLPSGALVALRRSENGRVLQIKRTEGFKTDRGPANWENEIATFLTHFDVKGWRRDTLHPEQGVGVAFYEGQ